jgi:hypothetical protein
MSVVGEIRSPYHKTVNFPKSTPKRPIWEEEDGWMEQRELKRGECQTFCVNPFSAFKYAQPNGPQ